MSVDGDNIIARRAAVPWEFVARLRRHRVGADIKRFCDAHGVRVRDLHSPPQHGADAARAARREIMAWMASVGYEQREIAELFGLDKSTVRRVLHARRK